MNHPTADFEFQLIVYRRDSDMTEAEEWSIGMSATSVGNARRKVITRLHKDGWFVAAMMQVAPPDELGDLPC